MKKEDQQLNQMVLSYISERNEPFSLAEIVADLPDDLDDLGPKLSRNIANSLNGNSWVFFDDIDDVYEPRHLFFNGKQFLIAPTPLELERGYIIPGHRFIAFAPRLMLPSHFSIRLDEDHEIPWKTAELPFSELKIYFSMLGYPQMMEYLLLEYQSNSERLLHLGEHLEQKVQLNVMDMGPLLDDFKPGGMLVLTVEDWCQGVYTLEIAPDFAKSIYEHQVETWCMELEESLDGVLEQLGPMADISEQLSWALYLGSSVLTEHPAIHLGGFLRFLTDLQFTTFNSFPMLWYRDEAPEDSIFEHLWPVPELTGCHRDLDSILQDVGSPLSEGEIEAYMRDELFRGGGSVNPVMARVMKTGGEEIFASPKQHKSFLRLINELWQQTRSEYNRFADKRIAGSRGECLEMLDGLMQWMQTMDRDLLNMEHLPKKEFIAIAGLMSMLTQTLVALNLDGEDIPTEGLETLQTTLASMRDQSAQLIQVINGQLKPKKKPVFRVIPGGLAKK